MKKIIALFLVICTLFTFVSCEKEDRTSNNDDLYVGYISDSDKFINMPTIREYDADTCGTTCIQIIMNWLYPNDLDFDVLAYEELSGTNEDGGTEPNQMINYFKNQNINYEYKEEMTIEELIASIDSGFPVILCIQAWGNKYNLVDPNITETYYDGEIKKEVTYKTYLKEGHWVICVGYKKTEEGYSLYFNDPACIGHCIIDANDLQERWIYKDDEGNIYKHFGLAIKETSNYNRDGIFYLN